MGAVGSLNRPPAEFPVYTQRWWPYLPLPFYVAKGSNAERELLASLGAWLSQGNLSAGERAMLQSAVAFLHNRAN
jgi:hypothetical protein